MSPSRTDLALAELWGIGEADPVVLGAVLVAVVIAAVVFIATRGRRRKAGD